jgi:hypothetical protein
MEGVVSKINAVRNKIVLFVRNSDENLRQADRTARKRSMVDY